MLTFCWKWFVFIACLYCVSGDFPPPKFIRIPYSNNNREPKNYFYKDEVDLEPASPRLLGGLIPGGLFREQQHCLHESKEGICYSMLSCALLAGNNGPICKNFRGRCCRFERTCGERTSQRVAYFTNNDDGLPFGRVFSRTFEFAGLPDCKFEVVKRDKDFCGLSLEPEILPKEEIVKPDFDTLPGVHSDPTEACRDTVLQIAGIKGGAAELSLCVARDAHRVRRYQVGLGNTSSVEISLTPMFNQRVAPVSVKVSQIKCDKYTGEDLEGTTVISPDPDPEPEIIVKPITEDPIGPPVTASPATEAPDGSAKPPAPPPLDCGRATSISSLRQQLDELLRKHGILSKNENAVGVAPYPPVQTFRRQSFVRHEPRQLETEEIVWDVPELKDTIFYEDQPPSILTTRITYGEVTNRFDHPWTVAMFVNNGFSCGASLISTRHVLTAAHCVVNRRLSSIEFRIGDWNLASSSDGPHITAKAEKILMHSGYSQRSLQNDIAVVKLNKDIDFSNTIQKICLPSNDDLNLDGKLLTVVGWGRNENKKLQSRLHKLQAVALSNAECKKAWTDVIQDKMLCISAQNADSCNGDSGGPAIYKHPSTSAYYQVGIVSFGSRNCNVKTTPGVYTRVPPYVEWIKEQLAQ